MTTNKNENLSLKKLHLTVAATLFCAIICGMLLFFSIFYLYIIGYLGLWISGIAFIAEMVYWKVKFGVTRGFKWFVSILIFAVLLAVWYAGVIISLIFGGLDFYFPFLTAYLILLTAWLIGWCCSSYLRRWMKYALVSLLLTAPMIFVGYQQYKSRQEKIPRLREDFSLAGYAPFTDSPLLARLKEEATLRMTDPLPVIDGATALYPLYAAFADATYPYDPENYDYDKLIRGGSTSRAYKSLIDGTADVIFCAQPSREQWEEVREKGETFLLTPIGKEAFVFFVNNENPVTSISSQEIRDIYSGKITNWQEVGGKNKKIIAFQRPSGSGSQTMLEHIMDDQPLMEAPQNQEIMGMGEIIDLTATYQNRENALGYSFLFFTQSMVANNTIRLIEIDGVAPNRENIMNGTYPFTGDFYAITLSEPSENAQRLIEWILSGQGQQLVDQTGYVTTGRQKRL